MCQLEHRCVVCDRPTLLPGEHAPRGVPPDRPGNCHSGFSVRCWECHRSRKLPDLNIYRPWWELTTDEHLKSASEDGRLPFFEVM